MRQDRGFTIVELLIVVVVIAILAAITIVSYNGIQNRAKQSAAQSSAKQAFTKVQSYAIQNADQYPATLSSVGINDADSTTFQYSVNNTSNPKTFCITATSSNSSYSVSNELSTPKVGGCPGHSANGVAAITNLIQNPGSESEPIQAMNTANGCSSTLDSDAQSGQKSTILTKSTNYCFARVFDSASGVSLSGKTIRITGWVKSPVDNVILVYRAMGTGYYSMAKPVTPNAWTRVTQTYAVAASDTSNPIIDFGYENANLASGAQFKVDSFMVTEGTADYQYADGNSQGWTWNGTVNNSTSTGPGRI
jgi:prepilin-type N-terminal cleavage/methylation domain-containing protein